MIGSSTKGDGGRFPRWWSCPNFQITSGARCQSRRARVGAWARHATPRHETLCNYRVREPWTGQANDAHIHTTDARTLTSGRCCHGDQDSRAGSGRTKNSRDDEAQLRPESKLFFIYLPEEVAVPDRIQDAWREEEPCMEGGGASYRRLKPQLSLSALAGWPPSPSVPNPTPAGTTLPSGQDRPVPGQQTRWMDHPHHLAGPLRYLGLHLSGT
jgi:hypothetical protein